MPTDLVERGHGIAGHAQSDHDTTSNRTQELTNPISTCRSASDRQNRCRSKGIKSSLINELPLWKRSAQDTSAQNIPAIPSDNNNTGKPPAEV